MARRKSFFDHLAVAIGELAPIAVPVAIGAVIVTSAKRAAEHEEQRRRIGAARTAVFLDFVQMVQSGALLLGINPPAITAADHENASADVYRWHVDGDPDWLRFLETTCNSGACGAAVSFFAFHEVAHLYSGHVGLPAGPFSRLQELEADALAGWCLRRHGYEIADVETAMRILAPACGGTHPAWAERMEAARLGFSFAAIIPSPAQVLAVIGRKLRADAVPCRSTIDARSRSAWARRRRLS